jgi:hypothetical protein
MFIEQSSYFRSLSHNHNDVSSEDHYAYLQSFRDGRVLERMPVFLPYMLNMEFLLIDVVLLGLEMEMSSDTFNNILDISWLSDLFVEETKDSYGNRSVVRY